METASRLRLIQVDFADASEQARVEYLSEEIERAVQTILPAERNEFLQKLLARFATGGFTVQSASKEEKVGHAPTIDEAKLGDVDFLVGKLLEIAPALSAEERESVDKSLNQAGFGSKVRRDDSAELGQNLKDNLHLDDGFVLNAGRIEELVAMLADFVFRLEPLAWNTWRELSPRSTLRPQGVLKKAVAKFMCDDTETTLRQVNNELRDLQRLIAAITTAVSRVGGQFAKQHLARFAPSEISALVRMEHGSVFVSQEVKCWRKYVELAEMLNADSIESAIRKAIVDYVESLVKGTGR
ncbi:MAG: hypothetical protein ACYTBJ_02545 [Planctomycetota bacterium]